MKARLGILAIAATLSIASAQAGTVIYDSINVDPSLRDTGNRNYVGTPNLVPVDGGDPVTGPWQIDPFNLGPLNLGGSGGIANSFNVSATAQITRVQLLMAADATNAPRDSFMVYLMQDVGGTPTTPNSPIPTPYPVPNGSVVNFGSATLLGTFSEADLSQDPDNPGILTIDTAINVNPGEYWIGVVGPWTSLAQWYYNSPDSDQGLGTVDQKSFAFDPAWGEYMTYAGTDGVFAMIVETPEPATLALLGVGLAGLGLTRRRMAR